MGVGLVASGPLVMLAATGLTTRAGQEALGEVGLWRAACASLGLASVQALAGVLLASMAAFGLTFGVWTRRGWGRSVTVFVWAGLMGLMALPGALLLPGGFELVVALGVFDTWWAVVLPGSLNVAAVLLYRSAFGSMPGELVDAARVDGCGEWGVWWRVAMPAVAPTTAACVVLSFAGAWGAVVWPTVVLQETSLHTLPMRVATTSGLVRSGADEAVLAVYAVVGVVPVLVVFALLRRQLTSPWEAGN